MFAEKKNKKINKYCHFAPPACSNIFVASIFLHISTPLAALSIVLWHVACGILHFVRFAVRSVAPLGCSVHPKCNQPNG